MFYGPAIWGVKSTFDFLIPVEWYNFRFIESPLNNFTNYSLLF